MYSTKRRKTKKSKRKKKVKGAKPVVPRLGGQKFAQQSIKESKRFSGTLLAGLPINTQTPAVTGLILEQQEAQEREKEKRREEVQLKRPELDLEPRRKYAFFVPSEQQEDDVVSVLSDDEASEMTGHRASVPERREMRQRGDPTMRNRPLSVMEEGTVASTLTDSTIPMSLDRQMELIRQATAQSTDSESSLSLDRQMELMRQAREDVGDESTVDRPFQIDEDVGERFYRATQEAATVTMPQRFTKTDIAKLNSSEFKEFASKRGIEINPNRGYRSGTTLRQEAVKVLFSGKKRGSTIG